MFNKLFGQKKEKKIEILAPVSGTLINLESVNDQVFSTKLMGEGFAIIPANGDLVSPIEGKITSIFPTKHAIQFESSGVQLLLHLGLETVNLEGVPFNLMVSVGQHVTAGSSLGSIDLAYLEDKKVDPTIITVFPELSQERVIEFLNSSDQITAGKKIMSIC